MTCSTARACRTISPPRASGSPGVEKRTNLGQPTPYNAPCPPRTYDRVGAEGVFSCHIRVCFISLLSGEVNILFTLHDRVKPSRRCDQAERTAEENGELACCRTSTISCIHSSIDWKERCPGPDLNSTTSTPSRHPPSQAPGQPNDLRCLSRRPEHGDARAPASAILMLLLSFASQYSHAAGHGSSETSGT